MTLLVAFDSKVERFFIRSKFNTFDELMLHHDVCSISFVEVMDYKALIGLSLLWVPHFRATSGASLKDLNSDTMSASKVKCFPVS
jgi:hypothetical protein